MRFVTFRARSLWEGNIFIMSVYRPFCMFTGVVSSCDRPNRDFPFPSTWIFGTPPTHEDTPIPYIYWQAGGWPSTERLSYFEYPHTFSFPPIDSGFSERGHAADVHAVWTRTSLNTQGSQTRSRGLYTLICLRFHIKKAKICLPGTGFPLGL